MSLLTLTPAHREHLRTVRGLTDEEINNFGFKSTPNSKLCRTLTQRLMKQGCRVQGVPGFYINDYGKWTVKFYTRTSGILIPLRGVDGLLHGLQIRLDHPIRDENDPPDKEGTKYLPLTSTGKNQGVSAGTPVHFVGDPHARVVYVTEGALKADVAHALTGRTFAATIGANNSNGLDELFLFLRRNGTEEIIEAEDMDKYSNMERSEYYLVDASGDVDEDGGDSKISCTKLTILKKLDREEFFLHALAYMMDHPERKCSGCVMRNAGVVGQNSFAVVRGTDPVAKGGRGSILAFAKEKPGTGKIIQVALTCVDGKRARPNVWYDTDLKERTVKLP